MADDRTIPPAGIPMRPKGSDPAPKPEPPAPPPPSEPVEPEPAFPPGYVPPEPDLREDIIDVLHTCYDPEIPVDIYELGLIYAIDISPEKDVTIRMTLTSPACPVAESLPADVERKVKTVPGVKSVKIDLVWDPPWGKHMMSEAALLQLGFY